MSVPCFIKSIDGVENLNLNDTYRVTFSGFLMDTSNSQFMVTFDAVKGSDWGIQARTAVSTWAFNTLGEVVDLVILPNLETI